MAEPVLSYIGLGSNLSDPITQVSTAIEELGQLRNSQLLSRSSLYRSAPVGPQDQPDFINAVVAISTRLEAHELLDELQTLELAHQRVRLEHWGPRTLDLDLLLYGQQRIDTPRLQIPHPFLAERNFVLYPLAEIAPQCEVPGLGTLDRLLTACPMGSLTPIRV